MNNLRFKKSNIPLYFQLEQIIKSKIMTGEYMSGEQIPTEKEFCEIYQVSSVTIRQAISNLVNEGLVVRWQGKGTFVKEGIKNLETQQLSGKFNELIESALKAGKVKVINISKMKAPKTILRHLRLEEHEEVVKIRRLRIYQGVPTQYIINYLPIEIGEKIKKEDLEKHPMLEILNNKIGLQVRNGIQYIQAIAADYEVASYLAVSTFSPILYFEAFIFGMEKNPIEFVQSFYRQDRFRYVVKLDGYFLNKNSKSRKIIR